MNQNLPIARGTAPVEEPTIPWISVAESLPAKGRMVLVWNHGPKIGKRNEAGAWVSASYGRAYHNVTHWCPTQKPEAV